jgi:ATP-dependent exoDNAse (exonuclease V) beta subunit
VADAEEAVSATDAVALAAPAAPAAPAAHAERQSAAPSAPAVRCFLHYLNALRATNFAVAAPAGEEDAVHVLTLHQSKGLEFPVIYLPGLAQGQFPVGAARQEDACPPGFRESDAPGERDAEERCLFYVGVTRARDVVVLTRAQAYGAQSRGAQPSSLLALLEAAPAAPDAPAAAPDSQPLLTDGEIEHLLDIAAKLAQPTDDDRDDGDDTADSHDEEAPAFAAMTARPVFHLRELEQYLTCPLQYKYAQRYRLLDPAEDAVDRFHRYIRQGARELHDLHTSAPGSDWPTAAARLKALWETAGPAGHAYDAFYWQRAE